jgi:hypothetical protein
MNVRFSLRPGLSIFKISNSVNRGSMHGGGNRGIVVIVDMGGNGVTTGSIEGSSMLSFGSLDFRGVGNELLVRGSVDWMGSRGVVVCSSHVVFRGKR